MMTNFNQAKFLKTIISVLISASILSSTANSLLAMSSGGGGGGYGGGGGAAMTFTPAANHYAALGIARGADDVQIRKAFIQLSRKWHPDRVLNLTAEERAIQRDKWFEIAAAWDILKNQAKKAQNADKDKIDRLLSMAKQAMATSAKGMTILLQLAKITAGDIDKAVRLGHIATAKTLQAELNDTLRNASAIAGSTSTSGDAKIVNDIKELSRLAKTAIARLEASSDGAGAGYG